MAELRSVLQKGNDAAKIECLKSVTLAAMAGQHFPDLLMPIIQCIIPSKNKQMKKLLPYYLEVCPKYDANGTLKQEMILVVNAIRNDLQHPNEYIRGTTLRFVQKLTDAVLLEPLVPTLRQSLQHRYAFVRKNAIQAIRSVFLLFPDLMPDAPETILEFLANESDAVCLRNGFQFLSVAAPEMVLTYLESSNLLDKILDADELMQLAILEFVRKNKPSAEYVKAVWMLLDAQKATVRYEAASALVILSQNGGAIKAAAATYISLIVSEADNNVKLIVLARLEGLRDRHEALLNPLLIDVLRILPHSPDIELRRSALQVALKMVTTENVEQLVAFLKGELTRSSTSSALEEEKSISDYRQLLIKSLHSCAIKFSAKVAGSVVNALIEFLGDSNNPSALDVVGFVREVVDKFPDLRSEIIDKLFSSFSSIKSGKVFRGALWIAGEYAMSSDDILRAFSQIREVLGEVPMLAAEQRLAEDGETDEATKVESSERSGQPKTGSKSRVREDGTYVTESAFDKVTTGNSDNLANRPPLRALILAGDFFTATVLASTLVKLVVRFTELPASDTRKCNSLRAESMLIMTSIVRIGQSRFVTVPIDEDSTDRILSFVQTLSSGTESSSKVAYLSDTKKAYTQMISAQEKKAQESAVTKEKAIQVQADDSITFRHFNKKTNGGDSDDYELDIERATGAAEVKEDFASKLSRIVQLTGFSDPVYAEAYVNVHQLDIFLDVLIVNQTSEMQRNLAVEFATLGDLKLVEKPIPHTLAAHAFHSIKATVKVSSTETGVIFGNIVYDGPGVSEGKTVILNDIHVDIMDYIHPAHCKEAQFRSMWTEFEWENKVNVNTTEGSLLAYLESVMKATNMACLTPDAALSGDCGFLSANLYARSLFGEDALANLSLEMLENEHHFKPLSRPNHNWVLFCAQKSPRAMKTESELDPLPTVALQSTTVIPKLEEPSSRVSEVICISDSSDQDEAASDSTLSPVEDLDEQDEQKLQQASSAEDPPPVASGSGGSDSDSNYVHCKQCGVTLSIEAWKQHDPRNIRSVLLTAPFHDSATKQTFLTVERNFVDLQFPCPKTACPWREAFSCNVDAHVQQHNKESSKGIQVEVKQVAVTQRGQRLAKIHRPFAENTTMSERTPLSKRVGIVASSSMLTLENTSPSQSQASAHSSQKSNAVKNEQSSHSSSQPITPISGHNKGHNAIRCNICGQEFTSAAETASHKKRFCSHQFLYNLKCTDLRTKRIWIRKDRNNATFSCPVCNEQCYSASEVKNHLDKHIGILPLKWESVKDCPEYKEHLQVLAPAKKNHQPVSHKKKKKIDVESDVERPKKKARISFDTESSTSQSKSSISNFSSGKQKARVEALHKKNEEQQAEILSLKRERAYFVEKLSKHSDWRAEKKELRETIKKLQASNEIYEEKMRSNSSKLIVEKENHRRTHSQLQELKRKMELDAVVQARHSPKKPTLKEPRAMTHFQPTQAILSVLKTEIPEQFDIIT